jgi:hypothetical protein
MFKNERSKEHWHYFPPEFFLDDKSRYGLKQDIFQLGSLIYELSSHKPAYPDSEVQ